MILNKIKVLFIFFQGLAIRSWLSKNLFFKAEQDILCKETIVVTILQIWWLWTLD